MTATAASAAEEQLLYESRGKGGGNPTLTRSGRRQHASRRTCNQRERLDGQRWAKQRSCATCQVPRPLRDHAHGQQPERLIICHPLFLLFVLVSFLSLFFLILLPYGTFLPRLNIWDSTGPRYTVQASRSPSIFFLRRQAAMSSCLGTMPRGSELSLKPDTPPIP